MQRKPGTQEPYGLLMETAFLPIFASLPKPTAGQEIAWTKAAHALYASYGVTTAHEGATHAGDLAAMKRAAAAGANSIDVIAYPFITDLDEVLKDSPVATWLKYDHRLFRALFTGPFIVAALSLIGLMFLFGKLAIRLGLLT